MTRFQRVVHAVVAVVVVSVGVPTLTAAHASTTEQSSAAPTSATASAASVASASTPSADAAGLAPLSTMVASEYASTDDSGATTLVASEDAAATASGTTASGLPAAAAMSSSAVTTGLQHVYVSVESVTATRSDDENAITTSGIRSLVHQLDAYWSGETDGRVRVSLSSIETRSLNRSSCSGSDVYSRAPQAAFGGRFAGTDWQGTNTHLIVLTREACGHTGMGSIGGKGGLIISGNGTTSTVGVPVVLHEFGHNLGFGHAGSSICRSTASVDADSATDFGGSTSGCPTNEYGDYLDIMGYTMSNATPHLSSAQRIRAGYLDDYLDIDSSATETITTTVSPLGGTGHRRALRIVDPESGARYYIEYRTASGDDASSTEFTGSKRCTTTSGYTSCSRGTPRTVGVVRVIREVPYRGSATYVRTTVMAVGSTVSRTRSTKLTTGWTFVSADAGFRARVNWVHGQSGASITVRFTTPPSSHTDLSVTTPTQPLNGSPSTRAHLVASVTTSSGAAARGNVRFYDGSRYITTSIVHSDGTSTILAPWWLAHGRHHLRAVFVPSTGDAFASNSNWEALTVTR